MTPSENIRHYSKSNNSPNEKAKPSHSNLHLETGHTQKNEAFQIR